MCKKNFHKELMIVETGYGFTEEDFLKKDGQTTLLFNTSYINYLGDHMDYKMSKDGQVQFIKDLLSRAEKAGVSSVCYWEPLWTPQEGVGWASKYVLSYLGLPKKTSLRNEWANQSLFDYEGNSLPSLWAFSKKK